MDKSPAIDAVDRILAQWQRERPDLDCSPMGPIGRLKRCAMLLEPQVEVALRATIWCRWEFDMLATLRRAGPPFTLSPTQLFSTLMITSGTMTHRLKALEKRGFITRLPNRRMPAVCWSPLTLSGVSGSMRRWKRMSIMNGSCWQDSVTASACNWIRRYGY